jgi:hypothetical protein
MGKFEFLADARSIVGGAALTATARRAEAIGYHALVVPDHLIRQLGPISAMAWVAAADHRPRAADPALGQVGSGIDHRGRHRREDRLGSRGRRGPVR